MRSASLPYTPETSLVLPSIAFAQWLCVPSPPEVRLLPPWVRLQVRFPPLRVRVFPSGVRFPLRWVRVFPFGVRVFPFGVRVFPSGVRLLVREALSRVRLFLRGVRLLSHFPRLSFPQNLLNADQTSFVLSLSHFRHSAVVDFLASSDFARLHACILVTFYPRLLPLLSPMLFASYPCSLMPSAQLAHVHGSTPLP